MLPDGPPLNRRQARHVGAEEPAPEELEDASKDRVVSPEQRLEQAIRKTQRKYAIIWSSRCFF